MLIQDIIGEKEEIILAALHHPALAPKRKPTIEQAMKAVALECEMRVVDRMAGKVGPALEDALATYELTNGEYGDVDPEMRDDYEAGLDGEVETVLEPYNDLLSQSWLGTNLIDTRLWEDGAAAKLATSAGKEMYKQLSYNKTPAQVLSNAGIVSADVEMYLEQHLTNPEPEKKQMSDTDAEGVCAKIKAYLGDNFDELQVYEDLELVLDDDEILANAAGRRIGLEDTDVAALQMAQLEHDEPLDTFFEMIKSASAKPAKASKPKADKKPSKPKAEQVEGSIDARVLTLLKEHGGTKDTDMATMLGVSRATYNNWLNGKTAFAPESEQYTALRNTIVTNANGLLEALALLDNTEKTEIA